MKLWAMLCRATQEGQVMVESSDKMWSTGERNGKPLKYSCLENPMNSMKRQKDRKLKDELPRSVGDQYTTGNRWKINSKKNEETEPKEKQHPVVDETGDWRKVWCCKEQYCIGTWNVSYMYQGKLEVVKQERTSVNVDILVIGELKGTGMGEFNSDDHYIYYCGQESLRRNGVAIIVNKRAQNAVLGSNLQNERIISVHFQGKPFNIMVIQVYARTNNAEEAEVELFCEDLQDLLELTPKEFVLFIIGNCNAKVRSQEIPGVTDKFGLEVQNEARQKHIEFCEENAVVIANTLFKQDKRRLYTWTSPDSQHQIIFFAAKGGKALHSQQKQDWELTVVQIMSSLLPNSDLNWRK